MDYEKLLKNYLDYNGVLIQYPTKRRLQIAALFFLSQHFEPGREYTEKEVNSILNEWHSFGDPCMLRRELYTRRFFDRKRDGSAYWLEQTQPTMASFGFEEPAD